MKLKQEDKRALERDTAFIILQFDLPYSYELIVRIIVSYRDVYFHMGQYQANTLDQLHRAQLEAHYIYDGTFFVSRT